MFPRAPGISVYPAWEFISSNMILRNDAEPLRCPLTPKGTLDSVAFIIERL
jgi:hypothetical protein